MTDLNQCQQFAYRPFLQYVTPSAFSDEGESLYNALVDITADTVPLKPVGDLDRVVI